MPHNPVEGCRTMAERWRRRVECARFDGPGAAGMKVTLSIGVAAYGREHTTPDDLVAAADAALYRAKKAGRNRVEIT